MRHVFVVVVFAFLCAASFSQTADLPRGYGGITLGMTRAEVEEALKNAPAFGYRGERDVSLLPSSRQTIIETAGGAGSFFSRSWFQFYEDKLYIMIINLNPAKADRFSVFTALFNKYGEPFFISPEKAEWRNEEIILSLENPLTLKYVDAQIFNSLTQQNETERTAEEKLFQAFLDQL